MFHQTMKTVNTESQRLCTCISYVLMYISIFYIHYMYFKIDLLWNLFCSCRISSISIMKWNKTKILFNMCSRGRTISYLWKYIYIFFFTFFECLGINMYIYMLELININIIIDAIFWHVFNNIVNEIRMNIIWIGKTFTNYPLKDLGSFNYAC